MKVVDFWNEAGGDLGRSPSYGLVAANPFGWHDFENLKDEPHKGDNTIPAGGSLTLRYRFYFHLGDEKTAQVAERYAEYSAGK